MKKILFASNNQGKIKEINQLLNDKNLTILTPNQVFNKKIEIEETGTTFKENAFLKASQMGELSGLITFADDSGLEIDALNGEPGVHSARYADSDEKRNKKVLKNLKDIPEEKRTARYKIAVCIFDPKTKKNKTVFGISEGIITNKPKGTGGFGYDSIFYSKKFRKTYAQLTPEQKNSISHRKIALEKLKRILTDFT